MFATFLCLLTFLPPQQPTDGGTGGSVPTAARMLPRDALLAVVVDRPADHLAALQATPLWQLAASKIGSHVPADAAQQVLTQLEAVGWDAETRAAMLQGNHALAWTPGPQPGMPGVLLTMDFPGAPAAAQRLFTRLRSALPGAAPEQWPGADAVVLNLGPAKAWLVRRDTALVLGNHRTQVTRALAAASNPASDGIAHHAAFAAEFLASNRGRPLLTVFARPAECADVLRTLLPEAGDTPRSIARALQLDRMQHAVFSLRATDGQIVERTQLAWPGPQRGLLAALAGEPGGANSGAARLLPTGITGFATGRLDWGRVFDEGLGLAELIDPVVQTVARSFLGQTRDRSGIDLRDNLIGQLRGRCVVAHWPGTGAPEFVLWQELQDADQFTAAARALLSGAGDGMTETECAGVPAVRVDVTAVPGLQPIAAVIEGHLVVGSSTTALERAIRQLRQTESDAEVMAFLTGLPPGAAWVSWSRGADGASHQTVMCRDDRGYTSESRSGLGMLGTLATPWGGVGTDLPTDAPPRDVPTTPARLRAAQAAPPTTVPASDDERAILQRAEQAGMTADAGALAGLLTSSNAAVAARAAWLLGRLADAGTVPALTAACREHADPQVRLQALAALGRIPHPELTATAIEALDDDDRMVRAAAAGLLGRGDRAAAQQPLLALLARQGNGGNGTSVDLTAALLALHDLGGTQCLLPAASSVRTADRDAAQALTFLFQARSGELSPRDEATTLMAVLDHPVTMLRRYAIQRLGELKQPITAVALEGRLAAEDATLQPLLRVSLAAVRGELAPSDDLLEQASTNLALIGGRLGARWNAMPDLQRMMVLGMGGLALLAVFGLLLLRRRMLRQQRAEAAVTWLESSADHVQEEPAEAEWQDLDYEPAEWAAAGTVGIRLDQVRSPLDVDAGAPQAQDDDFAFQEEGGSGTADHRR